MSKTLPLPHLAPAIDRFAEPRSDRPRRALRGGAAASVTALWATATLLAGAPTFTIVDLGLVAGDHVGSQALGISPGGVVTGRSVKSFETGEVAFIWTAPIGMVGLPELADPALPFAVGRAVNDRGSVVGVASIDAGGAKPRPVAWTGASAMLLPLPPGESVGRALAINAAGVIVGSVGSLVEKGAVYSLDSVTIVATTTRQGAFLQTGLGINDAGRIVGLGVDPKDLAIDIGYLLDPGAQAFAIGSLPSGNGALCIALSNAGHVGGGSNFDGGPNLPFIWHDRDGFTAVPLPPQTDQGAVAGVNSSGRAVGTAAGNTSIPFYFDGTTTHRLADLIPPESGWDFTGSTFATATGISEGGVIVGTGSYRGAARAYAMFPAPTCAGDLTDDGVVDGLDLGILVAAWGPVVLGAAQDLNGDGEVDALDLGLLLAAWGGCAP
ncbi:MAG TPA: dockerin type I domain-containing protein [Phycisphaerales bacterium]|nr:dockerin type I domain-containing protein [Phycisphaerales bacterium]HMP38575.1 dockerin type I domain-containing protein [Phycisphaerales bacterium]